MFSKNPHKFFYLLIALLLVVLVFPVLEALGRAGFIFGIFYSGILLSAAIAVSESRRYFVLALLLVGPAFVISWAANVMGSSRLDFVADLFSVLFLVLVTVLILSDVLKSERVTSEKIFGALSVYLLLGIIWMILYSIADFVWPGSFQAGQDPILKGGRLIYFSFVTLTTLGYGDIVPMTPLARSLATVEALTGQLYLTVLVARLVGLHIAHSLASHPARDEDES